MEKLEAGHSWGGWETVTYSAQAYIIQKLKTLIEIKKFTLTESANLTVISSSSS